MAVSEAISQKRREEYILGKASIDPAVHLTVRQKIFRFSGAGLGVTEA
jgi:hypothetical protein